MNFKRELYKVLNTGVSFNKRAISINKPIYFKRRYSLSPQSLVEEENSYEFSYSFLYNYNKYIDSDNVYVFSGLYNYIKDNKIEVDYVGEDWIKILYGFSASHEIENVLLNNIWLVEELGVVDLTTAKILAQKVKNTSKRNVDKIESVITNDLIIKGIWGLDYLFKIKDEAKNSNTERLIKELSLLSIKEYQDFILTNNLKREIVI